MNSLSCILFTNEWISSTGKYSCQHELYSCVYIHGWINGCIYVFTLVDMMNILENILVASLHLELSVGDWRAWQVVVDASLTTIALLASNIFHALSTHVPPTYVPLLTPVPQCCYCKSCCPSLYGTMVVHYITHFNKGKSSCGHTFVVYLCVFSPDFLYLYPPYFELLWSRTIGSHKRI